jgi:hypothetical protein
MSSDIKVKLFQSVVIQKNEDYLVKYDLNRIQASENGKYPFSENRKDFLMQIEDAGRDFDFELRSQKRQEAVAEGLSDPFNKLSVDIQLQMYLDGNNEWHIPIMESDIIRIDFEACTKYGHDQAHTRPMSNILILHRVPGGEKRKSN